MPSRTRLRADILGKPRRLSGKKGSARFPLTCCGNLTSRKRHAQVPFVNNLVAQFVGSTGEGCAPEHTWGLKAIVVTEYLLYMAERLGRMKKNLARKEFGMTYFPDLTSYTYYLSVSGGALANVTALNIGWLERGKPFPIGEAGWPNQTFLDSLALFFKGEIRVNRTRGFHVCEFCNQEAFQHDGEGLEEELFCSDEIRILGPDGAVYAAPTMLRHYITVHKYKPPEQFIQAVLLGPRPSSRTYHEACARSSFLE
jgi:hypothetical protein